MKIEVERIVVVYSSITSGSGQNSTTCGGGGRHNDVTKGKNDNTTCIWYKRGLIILF